MLGITLRQARVRTLSSWCGRTVVAQVTSGQPSSLTGRGDSEDASCIQQPCGWAALQRASFAKASKKGKKDGNPAHAIASFDASQASSEVRLAVEYLEQELTSVRTGRASPGLLDSLKVQVYGQRMPLKAAANVSVRDSQTLLVTAFDPATVAAIEKAISSSTLSLNPRTEGQELVIPIPRATKDTLAAMGKLIKQAGEAAKVKVRHARKGAVDQTKDLPSEDDQKKAEKQVQKMTDQFVADIDKMCTAKEKELHVL